MKIMSVLRLKAALFKEAEAEGALMKRSAAKQVEFWAELGKRIAHLISPNDMLVIMQGLAQVRVELPDSKAVNADQVFAAVDKASLSQDPGKTISRDAPYFESSQSRPGLLDQVMPDGSRQTGHFKEGKFWPE